jgi:lysophospholipase L1-like esterase
MMSVAGRRAALSAVAAVTASCVMAVLGLGAAGPAAAADPTPSPSASPRPIGPYVALGDSYAAGYGGGDESGPCAQSPNSYPDQLDGWHGIVLTENAACSGATTADVLASQLTPLTKKTKLVTISIGGNDLDAIGLADVCTTTADARCGTQLVSTLSLLAALPARLMSVYDAVAKAAPNAQIWVTGYSQLYFLAGSSSPTDFSTKRAINAATEQLDDTIKKAVADAHHKGVNIRFIPVNLTGHGIGASDPWIISSGPMAFHPNIDGYQKYAQVVKSAIA